MRGTFRLALLAGLVVLAVASNSTHRRIFSSEDGERLIGALLHLTRSIWRRCTALQRDIFRCFYMSRRAVPMLRVAGWQGETHRVTTGSSGGHVPKVMRFGPPTKGDKYHEEDLARGTWVEIISWRPRAIIIHNFLSPEEADQLIKIATPMMTRSTVVDSVTGESKTDEIRTR